MIVGYDLACYSYGSGPSVLPSMGYIRTDGFDESVRITVMRDMLRKELARNPRHPRTTSIVVTFHWGDDKCLQLSAGLLDRNQPEMAPYPYQADAMAEFVANVWVGEREPAVGVSGTA